MGPVSENSSLLGINWPAIKKAVTGLFASKAFRKSVTMAAICTCFCLAFLLVKNLRQGSETELSSTEDGTDTTTVNDDNLPTKAISSIRSGLAAISLFVNNRLESIRERFREKPELVGVPMPFDTTGDNEGWGVCTLRSKRRLGRSSFVQYEFDLPASDYVLPLDLGQQLSLCCLDNSKKVAKAEFFPYNAEAKKRLGTFSILAPNRTPPENEFAIGDDAANFVSCGLTLSYLNVFCMEALTSQCALPVAGSCAKARLEGWG